MARPTVVPDWTAKNVQEWWQEAFDDFKAMVNYDGIWLDMNEPASLKTQNAAEDDAIMRQSKKAKTQRDMYDFPPYDVSALCLND